MLKDFINGMSFLLSPFTQLFRNDLTRKTFDDDIRILKKDWENIGNDLRRGIDEFKAKERYES